MMIGKDGTDIEPGEFVPAAEKTGLILAIDRWALANAVRALSERARAGGKASLFVTLSEASIRDTGLLSWLGGLLESRKLEPRLLVLEFDESVASRNIRALKRFAGEARQLGVRMAIGHAGLASGCISLLGHYRPAFVKIDGALIGPMTRDAGAREKVDEITAAAGETETLVVAESVEDAQTLAAIWSSGVDFIQGYFVQPPSAKMDYDFNASE